MGEKTRTDSQGQVTKGWDHDPPAKEKLVPFGILILATGALTLLFGSHETSDFWGDCLHAWWKLVRNRFRKVRCLVIYLDNGPKNLGRRTQFLKRMIEFSDWSGLEIRPIYYPPYHSKYNPIERCWSSLQKKWNGVLLTCWEIVRTCALRMRWTGQHPEVDRIAGDYPTGVNRSEGGNETAQHTTRTLSHTSQIRHYHQTQKTSRQVILFLPLA